MHRLLPIPAITLAFASPAFAQNADNGELRNLTSNILASIAGKAPEPVETTKVETGALQGLVQQALSEGQSDAYLLALIDEAVGKDEIEAPDAMRTTTGDVDTRTLLASLIAKSEGCDSGDVEALAAEAGAEGSEEAQEDRLHAVVAGDRLAAISVAYYSSARQYNRILDANRNLLNSPERVQVGQVLPIPR